MPIREKKTDPELRRLQTALRENEKLMQDAAIKYEDLIAAKEDISAAIKARKEAYAKRGQPSSRSGPVPQSQPAQEACGNR